MKKYISKIGLSLAAIVLLFTACSEAALVKSDYDYKQDPNRSLATLLLGEVEKTSDETVTLSATVSNWGDSEVLDQGFMFSEKEDFSQYSALSIEVEELNPGTLLSVEDHEIVQGKTFYIRAFVLSRDGLAVSSTKSINLPITWEKVGTVKFKDGFWNGKTASVELQKFFGQNRYRLVDLYHIIDQQTDEPDGVPEGKHFVFYLDEDWNADYIAQGDQDIFIPPYTFHYDAENWGKYCFFTNSDNVYQIGAVVKEDGVITYVYTSSFEWVDGYPGEIPEPVVLDVSYKTDFSDDAGRAGWVLDKYSGFGEDDDVFYFDMADVGVADWGTAVVLYAADGSKKVISPSIQVEEGHILTFGLYAGLFTPEEDDTPAKIKVYIREEGSALDLGNPVKNWTFDPGTGGSTAIPLDDYAGKSIKVIFVVEQGDFLFYHFAVADTDDADLIFK